MDFKDLSYVIAIAKTQNITKQTKTSKVKTGDDTALFMYSLMLLVALLGFMLVLRKKVR